MADRPVPPPGVDVSSAVTVVPANEADFTVSTSGATQFMIDNGIIVKTCTQNLALWMPQLRNLLITILTSSSDSQISGTIDDLVTLSAQILNGIDVDKNGKIDIVAGECGAKIMYEYAYYMADMPISPVSISYQLTAAANATTSPISVAPTRTRSSTSSQSTQAPGNNPPPKVTKKPHPTPKPKGNGNAQP